MATTLDNIINNYKYNSYSVGFGINGLKINSNINFNTAIKDNPQRMSVDTRSNGGYFNANKMTDLEEKRQLKVLRKKYDDKKDDLIAMQISFKNQLNKLNNYYNNNYNNDSINLNDVYNNIKNTNIIIGQIGDKIYNSGTIDDITKLKTLTDETNQVLSEGKDILNNTNTFLGGLGISSENINIKTNIQTPQQIQTNNTEISQGGKRTAFTGPTPVKEFSKLGLDWSQAPEIAKEMGMTDYVGTADQNWKLVDYVKNKQKQPEEQQNKQIEQEQKQPEDLSHNKLGGTVSVSGEGLVLKGDAPTWLSQEEQDRINAIKFPQEKQAEIDKANLNKTIEIAKTNPGILKELGVSDISQITQDIANNYLKQGGHASSSLSKEVAPKGTMDQGRQLVLQDIATQRYYQKLLDDDLEYNTLTPEQKAKYQSKVDEVKNKGYETTLSKGEEDFVNKLNESIQYKDSINRKLSLFNKTEDIKEKEKLAKEIGTLKNNFDKKYKNDSFIQNQVSDIDKQIVGIYASSKTDDNMKNRELFLNEKYKNDPIALEEHKKTGTFNTQQQQEYEDWLYQKYNPKETGSLADTTTLNQQQNKNNGVVVDGRTTKVETFAEGQKRKRDNFLKEEEERSKYNNNPLDKRNIEEDLEKQQEGQIVEKKKLDTSGGTNKIKTSGSGNISNIL